MDELKRKTVSKQYLFLGTLLVILTSAPILSFYLVKRIDLDFHLARIEALSHALKDGQFPVRISGYWLDGYGYASSIFYGEFFLYFPAVLMVIGFSIQSAYKLYLLTVNLLTCLLTYYCLKKICKERLAAFMGTSAYMLAPPRLVSLYSSSAVGMYTAMVFLPLVVYGLYLIYMEPEEAEKREKSGWIWLFLGFSGLIQCHVISTFMTFLFTLLVCVIKIRQTLKKEILLQLIKAVICTVVVNLWFLLPFLDYMRFDYKMSEMNEIVQGRFAANGIFISQLISFFPHVEGASISAGTGWGIETSGIEMSYTLGGGIMLGLVLYVVYGFYHKWEDSPIRKMAHMAMGICILSLFMTTLWFPWDFLQQRSGTIAWAIGSLQFPWRFLSISSVSSAFVIAAFFYELRRSGDKIFYYGAVFSVGFLMLISANYFLQDCEKHGEAMYVVSDEIDNWGTALGEYVPFGVDETTFGGDTLQTGTGLEVQEYERGEGTVALTCANVGEDETYVDVPILYYKGYAAREQATGERLAVVPADNKRVRVIVPFGYQGSFVVKFEPPWYWRVSEGISLLAVIALIGAYGFCCLRKTRGGTKTEGVGIS